MTSGNSTQGSSGPALADTRDITQFSVGSVDGVITQGATSGTIALTLPAGTDVTSLMPTVVITGVSVEPASGVARDFTLPVTYVVTAENGNTRSYEVTITVSAVPASTGGTVALAAGAGAGSNVVIPAGALAADTRITVENGVALVSPDGTAVGPAVKFGPEGTQFSVPVKVTIPYTAALVTAEDTLVVLKRNDTTQELTLLEALEPSGGFVSAMTSSFSTFQAFVVRNPSITAFTADNTLVPSLGALVTLQWTTANATQLTLGAVPSAGLVLPSLAANSTGAAIRIPANPASTPVRYVFTLGAQGVAGSRSATRTLTVTVGANPNDVYTEVAAGWNHWLALRNDGQVVSWGSNYNDEASIPQDLEAVVAIAAGATTSLALKADGTVVMWGETVGGTYVVPAGITGVTAIAAGETHCLAAKSDGNVVAWSASNSQGEATVPPGLVGVVAVAAGAVHSLAFKSDGTVVGWGQEALGRISGPMALTNVVSISASRGGSVAVTGDGQAHYFGYLGGGAYPAPSPSQLGNAVATASAQFTHCVLKADGSVVAWTNWVQPSFAAPAESQGFTRIAAGIDFCVGVRADGSLGAIGKTPTMLPFEAVGMRDAVAVSVGKQKHGTESIQDSHTLVLRRSGTVVTWLNGPNACADLAVPAGLTGVTAVSAGGAHSLALKSDGTVVGWGCGAAAVIPAGLSHVTAIAAGGDFSLALKDDRTVVAWGEAATQAYWNPATGDYPPPNGDFCNGCTRETLADIVAIAAGPRNALALRANGTVAAWGSFWLNPVAPPAGLANVTAISIAGLNAVALKADGSVVTWGLTYNDTGNTLAGFVRNAVGVMVGSSSLEADATHPLAGSRWFAVLADGTVAGAGATRFRQTAGAEALRGVVSVSSGETASMAVLFDGTLKGWGSVVVGGQSRPPPLPPDVDRDGYVLTLDCNDMDPDINPGITTDTVGNMVDEDCDGVDGQDVDGDGRASVASGGDDCDDTDRNVFPGATERCGDGKDNDCAGGDAVCVATGWSATADMILPHGRHTATRLNNGDVLIVGQDNSPNPGNIGFGEVYSAATGTFDVTATTLAQARTRHAAALLADGRVMVVGGQVTQMAFGVATAETWNPITGTWTAAGSMTNARLLHSATLLLDGRVLVAGGFNNQPLSSAEVWSSDTNMWTPTGSMLRSRTRHTATRLVDGKVLMASGWDEVSSQRTDTAELYDPVSGTFTTTGSLPVAVQDAAAVLLPDGRVAVFGGGEVIIVNFQFRLVPSAAVQIYDPPAGTWSLATPLPHPAGTPTATLLANGSVLVTGETGRVVLWSPGPAPGGSVVEQQPTLVARALARAVLLQDGKVLLTGGQDPATSAALTSAEVLNVTP